MFVILFVILFVVLLVVLFVILLVIFVVVVFAVVVHGWGRRASSVQPILRGISVRRANAWQASYPIFMVW